jgi:hypothetical protein
MLDYKTGGRSRQILVEVGRPRRGRKGYDWYCPDRITGNGRPRIFRAHGVDALQALILSLAGLSKEITDWGKRDVALTWLGDRWLGLTVHAVFRAEAQRALDETKRRGAKLPKRVVAALGRSIRNLP